jgi:hypothetical protein
MRGSRTLAIGLVEKVGVRNRAALGEPGRSPLLPLLILLQQLDGLEIFRRVVDLLL